MLNKRASGVLLHISSLASDFGIGDLGCAAYGFVDLLARGKQAYWQVLPLNPVNPERGNSPYEPFSAFAGNTLLISPEMLVRDGLLEEHELQQLRVENKQSVNFDLVMARKHRLLQAAFDRFQHGSECADFEQFCDMNKDWLTDYSRFMALKEYFGTRWDQWPEAIRDRHEHQLNELCTQLHDQIRFHQFGQFLFYKQYRALKAYANDRGVQLVGDLPFYVGYDCADVWSRPDVFKLRADKKPLAVAGVPPDRFSDTGQLWGNPVYDWQRLRDTGYRWWIQRLRHNFELYDLVRVDHFRAFASYWEIPADSETAAAGEWITGPGHAFFAALFRYNDFPPIIVEDLGTITPDVIELVNCFGFPGMKVLLFGFDGDIGKNPYAMHNHTQNCVLFTGTHDNNTCRGWFEQELNDADRNRIADYLGRSIDAANVHDVLVKLVMMSVARVVVVPAQDVLGLGADCRMNTPAQKTGSWQWRLLPGQFNEQAADKLAYWAHLFGRA